MKASSSILPPPATSPGWSELLPDLLGHVIAHLPYPGERVRLGAVCRAWHAAAHDHLRHRLPPWVVLADGSFCTGDGAAADDDSVFFYRLPGLLPPPDDDDAAAAALTLTTSFVVVGSTNDWLLLDCTCDEERRKYLMGMICSNCSCNDDDDGVVVERKPSYLLRNAFTGATVPLPELDAVIDSVSRTFAMHKVLMRSSSNPGDDVIAVVTNNWDYNIILCRPGKGTHVLRYYDVFDVAFVEDWLYGLTPNENLIGFRLGEDGDHDGKPDVGRIRRIIVNPLPEGEEEDYWSWIDDDENNDGKEDGHIGIDNNDNQDGHGDGTEDNEDIFEGHDQEEEALHKVDDQAKNKEENKDGGHGGGTDDDEDIKSDQEEEVDKVDDDLAQNKQEEEENNKREDEGGEGEAADDEAQNTEDEEDCSSGDGMISDGVDFMLDEESLNEPKDYIVTIRKLVKSRAGELLMVRRKMRVPYSYSCGGPPCTCEVEIFKADILGGKWLPVTGASCLGEDEALFLSKSFSKSVRVHGDIRARFIYFDDTLEAFDTTSSTCIPSSLGKQVYHLLRCKWRTWIFPQELVV